MAILTMSVWQGFGGGLYSRTQTILMSRILLLIRWSFFMKERTLSG